MSNWRLVCALSLVSSVLAQPSIAEETKSEPLMVRISKTDCQRVVRHQASADVAYKPGVDVRGKAVAPADANGGFTIPLPDVFEFNITKDLTAYLGGAEDKLAADKAAAIAAERSVAATNAAVTSAETSLSGAETAYDAAVAAATVAQANADAAPNDATLAATAATAQAAAASAESNLAATQTAFDATRSAASADNVATALAQSQAALAAAKQTGYTPDAAATTESETAAQAASDAEAADTAAQQAAETVAKSADMTLNVGTVRYNISTGAMTFNGQSLTGESEADLAAQCRAMLSAK
jgi:hypothetical protein